MDYASFFKKATEGAQPFPYQKRLAAADHYPNLLSVPTGAGKTAAVTLSWLWRRRHAEAPVRAATPRRLVYCLPMRVLVEQTAEECRKWLSNLGLSNGSDTTVSIHVLMGGERDNDWDLYPENDAILIGTQDMLLSRALNRGYAVSRYRWPAQYALLHSDSLWVFDETQLFGVGLKTSAQLEAFRRIFGTTFPAQSLWMSATLAEAELKTVDAREQLPSPLPRIELEEDDKADPTLRRRLDAPKQLERFDIALTDDGRKDYPKDLATRILDIHQSRRDQTLVVFNTVGRAQETYRALLKQNTDDAIATLLIHSRFRPHERARLADQLKTAPPSGGRIIIATQAIEAGVDISSKTLITELAPWSSLVQRFGRCNRYGEYTAAMIYWIDSTSEKTSLPYTSEQLDKARAMLESQQEAGLTHVSGKSDGLPEPVVHVIRRKDMVDLFDTTPDLAGADIDISRFIRDDENLDAQLFWRAVSDKPDGSEPEPTRAELCSVPVNGLRDFVTRNAKEKPSLWTWDAFSGIWERLDQARIRPGAVVLADQNAGGYDEQIGWMPESKAPVAPVPHGEDEPEANTDDPYTPIGRFISIAEHSDHVVAEMETLLNALNTEDSGADALRSAARLHDWGKAHTIFQQLLTTRDEGDPDVPDGGPWAKSDKMRRLRNHPRPQFRHELASAIAALQTGQPDLVCYLVAAHHGKVRLSIRSMPEEKIPPEPGRRFARGIWEGDTLPACDLGGNNKQDEVCLQLDAMVLGRNSAGQPSWLERALSLRDRLGPFQLSYLEALLRAVDRRASKKEQ